MRRSEELEGKKKKPGRQDPEGGRGLKPLLGSRALFSWIVLRGILIVWEGGQSKQVEFSDWELTYPWSMQGVGSVGCTSCPLGRWSLASGCIR
jgi:hypothetical protein